MTQAPNLFLVGAPKAGTTTLYRWLEARPEVYCPIDKELCFFSGDRELRGARPLTYEEYLRRFEAGRGRPWRVDCSTGYLSTPGTAEAIAAESPDARVVVTLRDPTEVLYALFWQRAYNRSTRWSSLEEGLLREGDYYYNHVRFAEHLTTYRRVFGPDAVHVLVFDDLAADPAGAYAALCRFLGISQGAPPFLRATNASKAVTRPRLKRLLERPPALVSRVVRALPRAVYRAGVGWATRLYATQAPRPALPTAFERELRERLRGEVDAVGALLGRDLAHWSRPRAG